VLLSIEFPQPQPLCSHAARSAKHGVIETVLMKKTQF